jgi:hypothetical protein
MCLLLASRPETATEIGGHGVTRAVTRACSCARSSTRAPCSRGFNWRIRPVRRIPVQRSATRHTHHSLPCPAPIRRGGAAHFPTKSSLRSAVVLRAARQWLEHPAVRAGGRPAAGGPPAAAERRCGRELGRRTRTRCCWSTSASTGPATGAPFDPKASCRAPASPAASAGSTSSGQTSSRNRDLSLSLSVSISVPVVSVNVVRAMMSELPR